MVEKTPLIIKKNKKNANYMDTPNHDVPELKLEDYLPKDLIRNKQANLPNVFR